MKTIKFGDYIINICENTQEFIKVTHKDKYTVSVGEYDTKTKIDTYWFNEEILGENLKYKIVSSIIFNEMINSGDLVTEENIFIRAHEVTKWIMRFLNE